MASPETHIIENADGGAKIEPNISKELAYTDVIHVECGETTSADKSLWDYLVDSLPGVGRVNLLGLSCVAGTTATGDTVYVGTSAMGSGASAETLSKTKNGLRLRANALNAGQTVKVEIVPYSNVSMQLFPTSSMLPATRLVFSKTAAAELVFIFEVQVLGVRVRYVDLN
jgi:hypothetical protein